MTKKKILSLAGLFLLFPSVAKAHCPLCTAGAGALAVGAAYLGVNTLVVGILIGAFAVALSLWVSKMPKKDYVKYQKQIIAILVFISTIWPLMPLLRDYSSINLYWFGEYGSLFNTTYMYNKFLMGSAIGAVIMLVSPYLSRFISQKRGGKLIPYQGIILTFGLLIIASLIVQFTL